MSEDVEKQLGYSFNDQSLLIRALTHSSATADNNERLEFLGDAVLELTISEYLYKTFPHMTEGELTKFRASLVNANNLAKKSKALQIGEALYLGKGEDQTGGRSRESILADAFEAVIGAIYLDSGFDNAREFILSHMTDDISESQSRFALQDSKSILQEILQRNSKSAIIYRIIQELGPQHNKVFVAEVVQDNVVLGTGKGKSKKEAESNAAYDACKALTQNPV